jgi:hypothetical protein
VRDLPSYLADTPPTTPTAPPKVPDESPDSKTKSSTTKLAKGDSDLNKPIDVAQQNALVIIEGDYASGSGFVTKLHDQFFVVTNQHVLSGNKHITMTTLDGKKLPTNGELYGAIGYDVAIVKIPDGQTKTYLEILDDPRTNAKVEDQVTIPGNALGARVTTQLNGRLIAIGPELVEVSAQLEHGISGSPIIDRNADKVIGIATMSRTYRVSADNSGSATETRWYGYRVDNIDPNKGWVKMDWARFGEEGIKVRDAEDLYESLYAVLKGTNLRGVTNPLVHRAIIDYQAEISSATLHNNQQERAAAIPRLNRRLRSLADNGIAEFAYIQLYPYHSEQIKELDEFRQYLDTAFDEDNQEYKSLTGSTQ